MKEKNHITRVKGLPEERQCVKYPGYKCDCWLADPDTRRNKLRKLREKVGAYSMVNLLDPGLAERHDEGRKELCEGEPPRLRDRVRDLFKIRIV